MQDVGSRTTSVTQVLIATLLIVATLAVADGIFAPIAFALFILALVWPVQVRLQRSLPRIVALLITFLVVAAVVLALALLTAWSFSQVARWLVADASRLTQAYESLRLWLEERGIVLAVLWSDNFGMSWILRVTQTLGGRLNSTFSFWLVALVYVLLGLLEVEDFGKRLKSLSNVAVGNMFLQGSRLTAAKIRRYMVIRTAMSVITGLLVWAFAKLVGLPLAEQWGFIAFALNYIPFIGPLVATLLPTLLALAQFDTWGGVIALFVGLNLIQSIVGSYVEPRVAGSALSMSPVLVLFSVFLWGYLWGIFGAFIGVPISIAVITICSQHPSSKWVSDLFGLQTSEKE